MEIIGDYATLWAEIKEGSNATAPGRVVTSPNSINKRIFPENL